MQLHLTYELGTTNTTLLQEKQKGKLPIAEDNPVIQSDHLRETCF